LVSPIGQFDGGITLDSSAADVLPVSPDPVPVNPVMGIPPELGVPRLFSVGSDEPETEAQEAADDPPSIRYESSAVNVEVSEQFAGKKSGKKRGRKKGKKSASADEEESAPRQERREGLREVKRRSYKE
jgi:hypothetical protein